MKKTYTPEQKLKRRRRRVIFLVTLLLIIAVFVVALGIYNCWWVYNDETHPIHIERKLKEKYIWNGKYDSLDGLYPVRNVNMHEDKPAFIAETTPDFFVFIEVWLTRQGNYKYVYHDTECFQRELFKALHAIDRDTDKLWARMRYTMPQDDKYGADINWKYFDDLGIWCEADEHGEILFRAESPYKAAGVAPDDERYLFWIYTAVSKAVPVAKIDGEFINLISMKPYSDEEEQIETFTFSFMHKSHL